jgi:D-alanyl-D-alanine carboxypeptidase (penicillin-binding protein 5/6)
VKLASPEPIKVMVQERHRQIDARVVYNGPVRAPIQSGQKVGVAGYGVAPTSRGCADLCGEPVGQDHGAAGIDGASELSSECFAPAPRT